nr:MAG TPA: hypothetical protein [Caudoviricetes sp.]
MKVIESGDGYLEFDNDLILESFYSQDCCERNYLDFEGGLPVGTELPTMNSKEFAEAINIKEDGFSIKDIHGIPKWVQARSEQNGYYSSGVNLRIKDGIGEVIPKKPDQEQYEDLFEGTIIDY